MNFSVVIPAYNAQHTIRKAVDSCLNQTLQPIEIIIVNDASTDDTLAVLQSLPSSLINIINNITNQGVSFSRNVGWDVAKGDFIAFLDSDDKWHSEKLETCSMYLKKETSILYHDFSFEKSLEIIPNKINTSITSFKSILLSNPITPSAIVINRNIALRFDESMRYCEDHDLFIRLAYNNTLSYLALPLTIKEKSTKGLSNDLWNMRKGELKMYSKLYKLNPALLIITPILWLFSLLKHVLKKVSN